jgi:hypothetical protein
MVLSFVYLVFVSLLKLLLRGGRRVDVKDIEVLVLRHQLEVLRRQVQRPKVRPSDRPLLAAAGRLLPPARRHGLLVKPQTLLRLVPRVCAAALDIRARAAGAPTDRRQNARACAAAGAREPALIWTRVCQAASDQRGPASAGPFGVVGVVRGAGGGRSARALQADMRGLVTSRRAVRRAGAAV